MTPSLLSGPTPRVVAAQPPRLVDQVAHAARKRGASMPTTAQLVCWVRAYVLFHGKQNPRELDLAAFLVMQSPDILKLYADSHRHRHLHVLHRARPVHRSGSLRRAPPARPQAATGAASVLQAGELLRGPQGPAGRGQARPDRLWLRRVDLSPAAAGGFASPDGQSPQRADRGSVCAYNRQAWDKDASGDSS